MLKNDKISVKMKTFVENSVGILLRYDFFYDIWHNEPLIIMVITIQYIYLS